MHRDDEESGKGAAPKPPAWKPYNIKSDPLGMNDLHGEPQYAEI
ncbi:MAG: hypothetical protein ABGZ53_10730 [Fuerstiella sp.]